MKLLAKPKEHVADYSDQQTRDRNGVCLLCNGAGRRIYTFFGKLVEDVCGVCGGRKLP